jgi:hypothetical protein
MESYHSFSRTSYPQTQNPKAVFRQTSLYLQQKYGDSASSPEEDVNFGLPVILDRKMGDGEVS